MRRRLRVLIVAGTFAAVFLGGRGASAFVRAVSDTPPNLPLSWSSSCETVTIYLNGFTAMTPDEVAKSIGAAAAAWGPDAVTCPATVGDGGAGHPYFEILSQLSASNAAPLPANDGRNVIVFETTTWDPRLDPAALAVTSVWKEPSGNIVDADIQINATNSDWEWANLDPGAAPGMHGIPRYDLQTVMTHEFGHFLGLAHTCNAGAGSVGDDGNSAPPSNEDDQGQPIPTCDDTGVPQYASVMWALVESDSIAKRALSRDDARGVCSIYPSMSDPHSCTQNLPDDGCGCAVSETTAGRLAGFVVAAVTLVLVRQRGRRRRPNRRS